MPIPDCIFQQEEDGAMTRFDWRDAESYEEALSFDAPALAWEFLRRNPDYRADHHRITSLESAAHHTELSEFRRKWGLNFRC